MLYYRSSRDTPLGNTMKGRMKMRLVDKGKNSIGYSAYNKQVPNDTRKHKTMQHPRTPDHKANIPSRRWLGFVSAW